MVGKEKQKDRLIWLLSLCEFEVKDGFRLRGKVRESVFVHSSGASMHILGIFGSLCARLSGAALVKAVFPRFSLAS